MSFRAGTFVALVGLAGIAGAASCNRIAELRNAGGDDGPEATKQGEHGRGRLDVKVANGLAVSVDGEAKGAAPIEALEVDAGQHEIVVDGPCSTATARVDVKAGASTAVTAEDFDALDVATLKVVATALDGSPVEARVTLGDWTVPGAAAEPTEVPACELRLRVAAEGVGAFVEDLQLEGGQTVVREVTLVPGPDVVRIHGGPFKLGPPGPDHYDPDFEEDDGEDVTGWPWIPTYDVEVATFDIDRTEVTAAQFHACYAEGGCKRDPVQWGGTIQPGSKGPAMEKELEKCSTEVFDLQRKVKQGRGDHPANCVAMWEAEQYCAWVGKRLPTDVEWEYAARSGKADQACPWGGGFDLEGKCDRSKVSWGLGTQPVCSHPRDDTEQGLCDMAGGVNEMVTWGDVPSRPGRTAARGLYKVGYVVPFEAVSQQGEREQSTGVGFRCVRVV